MTHNNFKLPFDVVLAGAKTMPDFFIKDLMAYTKQVAIKSGDGHLFRNLEDNLDGSFTLELTDVFISIYKYLVSHSVDNDSQRIFALKLFMQVAKEHANNLNMLCMFDDMYQDLVNQNIIKFKSGLN